MHDQWIRPPSAEDKVGLRNLLEYIHKTRGIDFTLYRFSTFRRRLELRQSETSTHNYREYLEFLRSHPEEIDILIQALTIKLSNFFRNPLVYEFIYSYVLPQLLTENQYFLQSLVTLLLDVYLERYLKLRKIKYKINTVS